ncbi:MAG: RNase adapter protein RapZ [Clostridiales bacterium]|nr:RNase adapter protein RapZ [Clostridiales bacterium]
MVGDILNAFEGMYDMRFVIVTGLSGAGKSQTLHFMEDFGFFCVDNLPPLLIPKFAELCFQSRGNIDKIAVVTDIRGGQFFNDMAECLSVLKQQGYPYEILFLEASDPVLIKRFKETRRRHPLASEGRVAYAIAEERSRLQYIKEKATYIIDTSELLPKQLKEQLHHLFVENERYEGMTISIISFGYKYGLPLDADLVFDVRFLPNPFYVPSLKEHTGLEKSVREYVLKQPETPIFVSKLKDLLSFLIPGYIKEGKNELVIAIGCTGGMHRSVTIAEVIKEYLMAQGYKVMVEHRDVNERR